MISDKDRSGYFGASDTSFIMGNYETKTFEKWWLIKLGIHHQELKTEAIMAGNNYEHKIIDKLEEKIGKKLQRDKQIIIDRLRVNLDSNTEDTIYEIKTYKSDRKFNVSKQYWRQVQVQMYATGIRKAYIVAYPLSEQEYSNYLTELDKDKIELYKVEYDEKFIDEYKEKLKILTECIKKGTFPI